jgi:hypothetical protein
MKIHVFTLLSCICSVSLLHSQETDELPYVEEFESGISGWTTQNTQNSAQWYWNTDEGYAGSNSVSFTLNLTKPYDVNTAWLVSPNMNTSSTSHVKISFKYMRWRDYLSPRLYYTQNFTGDVTSTIWEEHVGLSWGTDVLEYYDLGPLHIETPGNDFRFAFCYETSEDIAAAFNVDNFMIQSYEPTAAMQLVGSSEHFEYYTNISGEDNYSLSIEQELETAYLKYGSLWERPEYTFYPEGEKIKVRYCQNDEIPVFHLNTRHGNAESF